MGVTINDTELKKWTHNGIKVKKWIHNNVQVWSGATVVKYYDSESKALIKTEEVDEGLDVLHPTLPTKSGYTHVGWKYNNADVTELTAIGEEMELTAVYLPNSLVVASCSFNGFYWNGYEWYSNGCSTSVWNSQYVSGGSNVESRHYEYQYRSTDFTLKKGAYQTAIAVFGSDCKGDDGSNGNGYTPAGYIYGDSGTLSSALNDGTYTIGATVNPNYATTVRVTRVASITLSNPKPWV